MVERKHIDASALEISEGAIEDIERASFNRTSKYTAIVEKAQKLTPGKGLMIPVPEGVDPGKFRLNIANAVRDKTCGAWLAEGKEQTLRVVLAKRKKDGAQVVAINCVKGSPEKKPRGKKKASTSKAKAKATAKK